MDYKNTRQCFPVTIKSTSQLIFERITVAN